MYKTLFFIGAGSFIGGVSRYLCTRWAMHSFVCKIPLGTLLVNILGCFIIGILYGIFDRGNLMNNNLRMFLTVGFCGGFTTFSTFMNESFMMLKADNLFYLSLYLSISLIGGFAMLYVGQILIKLI